MPVNSRTDIIQAVKRIAATLIEKPGSEQQLDVNKPMEEIGLDSVLTINMIVQIEQHFDIAFDDDEMLKENFATLNVIAGQIARKLGVLP